MAEGQKIRWGGALRVAFAALLLLSAVPGAFSQGAAAPEARAQIMVSSRAPGSRLGSVPGQIQGEQAQGEVVREIDDPHSGERWLLMRNASVPGGPGRLVRAGGVPSRLPGPARDQIRPGDSAAAPLPVIRAGERVIVEENSAVAEARLEAVALGPAAIGAPLEVRLTIGGKVARAVALAPGRAEFKSEMGVRP